MPNNKDEVLSKTTFEHSDESKKETYLEENHEYIMSLLGNVKSKMFDLTQRIAEDSVNSKAKEDKDLEKYIAEDEVRIDDTIKKHKTASNMFYNDCPGFMDTGRKIVQGEIEEAAEELNNRILSDLNEIAKTIQGHFKDKMKSSDIQTLPVEIASENTAMTRMIELISKIKTIKELVRIIHDYSDVQGIIVPKESMLDITNQGKYLEFLKNIRKENLEINSTSWVIPFQTVSEFLHQSQIWYTFLNALYGKLSEYEIQKYRQMYNVANLDDWGKIDAPQGIKITSASFKKFLNKIATLNITEQNNVQNMKLTDQQLEELNHALNLTLKHTVSTTCEDSSVIIKGSFLRSGEIIQSLDTSCNPKNITSIGILSLHTVFIDSDNSTYPIFIMAPKWEVVDQITIDLTGLKGVSSLAPFHFSEHDLYKAAKGTHPGAKGADGKPGGPGKPGGIFFGIGEKFLNGSDLTIKAIGGEGGAGEHGGDGYSGKDGKSADDLINNVYIPCQNSCNEVHGFKCQKISYSTLPERCYGYGGDRTCYPEVISCEYKLFGTSGEKGGDGGDGGRGGNGGQPGNITLFELDGDSGIRKIVSKGDDGENGKGGKGGVTGSDGDDIIITFGNSEASKVKERIKKRKGPSGKDGRDGANTVGQMNAKPPNGMEEAAKVVNKYKSYLRENMIDRFTRINQLMFIGKINDSDKINSIYDTAGFIDEFEGLEKQFHSLGNDVDFVPFYQSLLSRISEYSKNPKDDEKSIQHKKVLNFLYTTILGRISNLKDKSESDLIVNIDGYLDIVKREIGTLRDLEKVTIKSETISKYQERYKDTLDRKVEEAKHIVDKLITPEIENISKDIDDKIDVLVDETMELQRKAEEKRDALVKKKQELEKAMEMRGLFSYINIFAGVVGFFGPVGAAVGAVIGATSSVAESLSLDNQQQTLQIPPDVVPNLKILGDQIKSVRDKRVNYLDKLLEEISQEIKTNPEQLGDISEKIADFRNRLNKIKENSYNFKEIKTLESELQQELKTKEGQLKTKGIQPDDKTKGILKVIQKFSQVIQLGSLFIDTYNKHESDQEKVDAITDAIATNEEELQKLKAYEEQIYEIISPTLQNMENNLQDVANKLESKSQVSLDVSNWKVQSALKDMKLQMQQLTKGFQVKEDLARCIEKLEEVMSTLIIVYDRIQNYQDQQNLANYIADISSSSSSSITITNPTLVKTVNHLEMVITANLVLTQYKAAVNAFKQWVFPFANYYLEKPMLPSQLELEKSFENLVDRAVKQIESIKLKLDLYRTSVKNTDKFIRIGEFSSRYVSTKPFYVWKNDGHKDVISKLLSGQEVVLKADVRTSAIDKDAIKFSVVELYFKTSNQTLQSQINNVIKGFDITLTHLGNSYYRYADKVYVITSDSQTIWYSCEKNEIGEPVRKNIVFDKIKEGDLMLSPYTLWEVKLSSSMEEISFGDLYIYKDYVDLELSGYGSYVGMDTKGLKFAEKEYKSMGKIDKLNEFLKSERRNFSKCNDLFDQMISTSDHALGYGDYMTNGADPGLWSPLNYALNFLKMHIALNLVNLFIPEVKNINIDSDGDVKVKLSTDMGNFITEINMQTAENNAGGIEMLQKEMVAEDKSKIQKLIDVQCGNVCFSDRSNLKTSFLLDGAKAPNNYFSQRLDVNCSLLLADLVTRRVTGQKYGQAVEECLLSPKEKLEMRLDECIIQNEKDFKSHLHSLSRMTDARENTWLNVIKSYTKSAFQYFGINKNPGQDEFVKDIRVLFA